MYYTTKDGCQLYYEVYGKGETLVLLHGNGEDGTYFKNQIEYFQQFYQVVVIDMRAHGKSQYTNTELNFMVFAQDVVGILEYMGLEKVHLLGFSDGGNTALTIALHYPNYVESLIVNGADLHPSGVKRRYQIPIIIGYAILCMFPMASVKKKREVMNLMVHHPNIKPVQLHTILCPTLVLVGDHDMITRKHSLQIAHAITNATFKEIKGTHFIALKESTTYNRVVKEFLDAQHTK